MVQKKPWRPVKAEAPFDAHATCNGLFSNVVEEKIQAKALGTHSICGRSTVTCDVLRADENASVGTVVRGGISPAVLQELLIKLWMHTLGGYLGLELLFD